MIYDNVGHLLETFGPLAYSQQNELNRTHIEKDIQVILEQHKLYKVVVTCESIGVNVSTNSTIISW